MRKTVIMACVACLALSACGSKSGGDNKTAEAPPPLYENPPFGASDIDATVDETRKRMAPQQRPPAPNGGPANAQDAAPAAPGTAVPN